MSFTISVEPISSYERRLNVTVPREAFEKEVKRQFQLIAKEVKIKGFRPGHAPVELIRERYMGEAKKEALSQLVEKSYIEAVSQHDLFPMANPKIEIKETKPDGAFSYTATVEVKPSVEPKHYKEISLKKEKQSIQEKEVDQALQELQESKAELHQLIELRGVQPKDFVVCDFKMRLDGEVISGGSTENFLYELGSRRLPESFEAGLLGMKPPENKNITVTYDPDFHEKKLAGKEIVFEVVLKEIKVKRIPTLDDEFAKGVDNCTSLTELKGKVKNDLEKMAEERTMQILKQKLLEALVEKNQIEVPPTMVKTQQKYIEEDTRERMKKMGLQGEKLEEMIEKWKPDVEKKATFDVRVVLLSEAIARQENIRILEEDLEKTFANLSQTYGIPSEKVRSYYEEKELFSQLKWQLLQEKVINWLLSQATIKE